MLNQPAPLPAAGPSDTRTRIVEAARRLFLDKGYGSTSIADILREAAANSGSLYHYFATKQDLLLAVLESYREGIGPMLLAPAWRGVDDPLEKVFALLGLYRELLVATDFAYGCPIGSLALELHEPDPVVRESLAANFSAWTAAVQQCLQASGMATAADARAMACLVLAVMEGAVMQARTFRSAEPFDACVGQLRGLLAARRGGALPATPSAADSTAGERRGPTTVPPTGAQR